MAVASDVNAVGRKEDKTNDQSAKTCFSCGKTGHFSRDPFCPAKGRKCSSCSMYGHCGSVLQIPQLHLTRERKRTSPKKIGSNQREFGRQTNQVEDYVAESSQEEENPAFAFTVRGQKEEDAWMNVIIDGIVQEVLTYSGTLKIVQGNCLPMVVGKSMFLANWKRNFYGKWKVASNFVVVKCGRYILAMLMQRILVFSYIGPQVSPMDRNCKEVKGDFARQL